MARARKLQVMQICGILTGCNHMRSMLPIILTNYLFSAHDLMSFHVNKSVARNMEEYDYTGLPINPTIQSVWVFSIVSFGISRVTKNVLQF